jgi:AcrR family transcriptional regulator
MAEAPYRGDPTGSLNGDLVEATDGRVPGKRGQATRMRLLESTSDLLRTTSWRSITVIDIARAAGTSPATFYQYFENFEQAILVLAEELVDGAAELGELVDGDWSEPAGWDTACQVVDGFMAYWERNRSVFRVVELATEEGDLRFQGLRVRALNAVTVSLAKAITVTRAASASAPGGSSSSSGGGGGPAGSDPMAVAATLVSMLAHVAAHRYGYEFWGLRTASMSDVEARLVYWAVTGRTVVCDPADLAHVATPRTGGIVGGGAARATVESARARRHGTT